jgi:hypothetical protein
MALFICAKTHMTKSEVLEMLLQKGKSEHSDWLLELGAELTISARTAYPVGSAPGDLKRLVGFNEMQHRIYGYHRHARVGDEWPISQLIETLLWTAAQYRIEGDFVWALKRSLRICS